MIYVSLTLPTPKKASLGKKINGTWDVHAVFDRRSETLTKSRSWYVHDLLFFTIINNTITLIKCRWQHTFSIKTWYCIGELCWIENKKNQTDKIRSVQNSSGYGLTTTDVRLGNDEEVLDAEDEELNENGDKDQESDDEEKLSLNQKLMARMAHNINSFGTTLSNFVSKSVESTNTTSSLLRSHLASDSSLKSLNGSLEAERSSGASLSSS